MADKKISEFTNGSPALGTDEAVYARSGANVKLNIDSVRAYSNNAIIIEYSDIATTTDLIPGQLYEVINWPAFDNLLSIDYGFFYAIQEGVSGAFMSKYGTATAGGQGSQRELQITFDWYNTSKILSLFYPDTNLQIYEDASGTSNFIQSGVWNSTINFNNSVINDLTLLNFDPAIQTFSITNSILMPGCTIDMAGFDNFVMDHCNIGGSNTFVVTGDNLTIQDIRTGTDNTIYLPANGINGGIWGSGNTIGGVSLGFTQFDNITMGNANTITPSIDGTWSLSSCEWGDGKTHVILNSFVDKFWIGQSSTFDYLSDLSVDCPANDWTLPNGYGIIYMSGAAGANITDITQADPIPRYCLNNNSTNVFDTASGAISIQSTLKVTTGNLEKDVTPTTLTLSANEKDNFTITLDFSSKKLINNVNLY